MKTITAKSSSNETSTKSAGVKYRQIPGPKSVPFFTGTNTCIQTKSICPCDGGCPRCSGVIQPKLKIGQPNDKYEQEADFIADQVMRMPEPKQSSNQTPHSTSDLNSQIQSMKGGGQPLPKSVRNYFEPRFGHDFSHVRVHADSKAGEAAKYINAKAFTIGRDVFFGPGQYSPGDSKAKRLLAHELTHVVQQSKTESHDSLLVGNADSSYEIEAASINRQVAEGTPSAEWMASTVTAVPTSIQRQEGEYSGALYIQINEEGQIELLFQPPVIQSFTGARREPNGEWSLIIAGNPVEGETYTFDEAIRKLCDYYGTLCTEPLYMLPPLNDWFSLLEFAKFPLPDLENQPLFLYLSHLSELHQLSISSRSMEYLLLDGFEFGKAELTEQHLSLLTEYAEIIKRMHHEHPYHTLIITGHTDENESEDNQALGQQRADAVRDALVTREVPLYMMMAESRGASQLIVQEGSDPGNRRVEIRIDPEIPLQELLAPRAVLDIEIPELRLEI